MANDIITNDNTSTKHSRTMNSVRAVIDDLTKSKTQEMSLAGRVRYSRKLGRERNRLQGTEFYQKK